jgi:catechol 2,3-dioxygenase-like lactoylglutathione lyase family enzyme
MRVHLTSVYVDDQEKALRFYSDILGFEKKEEFPVGEYRWLTLVFPAEHNGTQLLLGPDAHPAVKPFKDALVDDGIPFTSFAVEDDPNTSGCDRSAFASPSNPRTWARRQLQSSKTRAGT